MTKRKLDVVNNAKTLLKGKEVVYNGFENGILSLPRQSAVLFQPDK